MGQLDLKTNNRGVLAVLGAAVLLLVCAGGFALYRASLPPPRPDPPMSAENEALTRLVPFVPTPTSSLEPPGYGSQQPTQVTPGNVAPQADADRAAAEVRAAQGRYSQAQAAPTQDVPGSQAASAPPAPQDPYASVKPQLLNEVLPDYIRQLELDQRVVKHVQRITFSNGTGGYLATVEFTDGTSTGFTSLSGHDWKEDRIMRDQPEQNH